MEKKWGEETTTEFMWPKTPNREKKTFAKKMWQKKCTNTRAHSFTCVNKTSPFFSTQYVFLFLPFSVFSFYFRNSENVTSDGICVYNIMLAMSPAAFTCIFARFFLHIVSFCHTIAANNIFRPVKEMVSL